MGALWSVRREGSVSVAVHFGQSWWVSQRDRCRRPRGRLWLVGRGVPSTLTPALMPQYGPSMSLLGPNTQFGIRRPMGCGGAIIPCTPQTFFPGRHRCFFFEKNNVSAPHLRSRWHGVSSVNMSMMNIDHKLTQSVVQVEGTSNGLFVCVCVFFILFYFYFFNPCKGHCIYNSWFISVSRAILSPRRMSSHVSWLRNNRLLHSINHAQIWTKVFKFIRHGFLVLYLLLIKFMFANWCSIYKPTMNINRNHIENWKCLFVDTSSEYKYPPNYIQYWMWNSFRKITESVVQSLLTHVSLWSFVLWSLPNNPPIK